jgi:hypothetical protein
MHLAFVTTGVGEGVAFKDRQAVHVGSQADGASTSTPISPMHDTDHGGLGHVPVDGDAPFGQARCDQVGGAVFFKSQLRVGMNVTPDAGHVFGRFGDGGDESHVHW